MARQNVLKREELYCMMPRPEESNALPGTGREASEDELSEVETHGRDGGGR